MAIADGQERFVAEAVAGEPLSAGSSLYVVRSEAERKASQTILEPGALVRIRGSYGMGKTSLVNRLLGDAAEARCKTASLSFNAMDSRACNSLDDFLYGFCLQVAEALQIPPQLDDYWDDFFGSTICCKSYFEEYLLPELAAPVVLALDDVDRVFPLQELADDFFGLLRAWHEEAKTRELWQQLRLIVAHSTDLYVPQNINKSPFNVGLPIDLLPLSVAQMEFLLERWQLTLAAADQQTLTQFVGGNPELAQQACRVLVANGGNLVALLQSALSPESPFAHALQRVGQALTDSPELSKTLTAIATGTSIEDLNGAAVHRLDSLGLVKITGQKAQLSCELYAQWCASR